MPEPLVTCTSDVPWVNVPARVKSVPDVPVNIMLEALAVNVQLSPFALIFNVPVENV